MEKKTIFISGVTSGIGLETAKILLEKGHRIIGTGRRKERLEDIFNQFGPDLFLPLCFDLSDMEATETALKSIPEDWQAIDILFNNAGNAHGLDFFQEGNRSDWEAMVDINIKGLVLVTEFFLPGMIARKKGHIINMGSVAADQIYPKGAMYCASKAAVSAFTQGLRMDLNAHGIKVSEIKPGMVETEFSLVRFKGDEDRAQKVYQGLKPLSGKDVAEVVVYMMEAPAHVNLAEILIMPLAQASTTLFNRQGI
jgi:3-hydroxy acid dehydrogenase/malonic semialdehyde reductase